MKFENKIDSMLAQGKLNDEQANVLRASLSGAGTATYAAATGFHNPLPFGKIIFPLAVVGVIALLVVASGGQDTQTIQVVSETINQSGKVGEMSKPATSVLSILLFSLPVIASLIWFITSYNGLVSKEEDVLSSWAQVESNYQRRADLIPNLVKTVKAFAEHEGDTLGDIAKLRSQMDGVEEENTKIKTMAEGAALHLDDDAYMANLAQAQQKLTGRVKGLMVAVEAYPNLRSSDQFLELQAELEGTENRINVARMTFNEKVGEFNASIRRMPGSLVAGFGDFQRKAYFKADEGAAKVVPVDFDSNKQE